MTEHYLRFSIGVSYLESAIYYTLLDNDLYRYRHDNIGDFLDYVEFSGDYVRTLHIYIENVDGEDPDANLAKASYVGKTVQTDCLLEVKAGTCDAAVLDLTLAKAMIGEGTDYSDLVIVDELAVEYYGVAFRKGSDVRDEVNKIFEKFIKDGTMQKLADKYGLELAD